MTAFLIAASLLLAATLALLLRPWWRRHPRATASRREMNAAIYRDQLAELERDRAGGQLGEADYQAARAEVQRRLLEDAAEGDSPVAATPRPHRTLAALIVLLPAAAAGLYVLLGNPGAMDGAAPRQQFTAKDVENMVASLAAKLEQEPGNLEGWVMLGRSYKVMRRFDEAVRAYERAGPLVEQDPQLLADYADLLAMQAGGNLEGRPSLLIAQALQLDPNHMQALWMAGSAAFRRQDFAGAARYWEHARQQLPPDSEDAQMLGNIIAEARAKAGSAGSADSVGAAKPAGKAAAAAAISGKVELAAAVKAQAAPTDTVFVLAREAGGSPMPLAVLRTTVAQLPLDFRLDDSNAIAPDRVLSAAKSVAVEARVSKSGDAAPRPGDLHGRAGPVKPGAKGLRLSIDTVVQ